jgi:hypothetical protein
MKITTTKIIIGITSVVIIWALSGYLISSIDPLNRGSFGDMFGAINALFSGLALFGIIISILIQQKELNSQRQELEETRMEFKTNRITSILFKQIEFLNSTIDNIKFYPSGEYQFEGIKKIDDFTFILNDLQISQKVVGIKVLIKENINNISLIITCVHTAMTNFDEILATSGLEKDIELQIKKLFKSNISPSLSTLFFYHTTYLKFIIDQIENDNNKSETKIDIKKLEISMYKSDLEKISKITNYG